MNKICLYCHVELGERTTKYFFCCSEHQGLYKNILEVVKLAKEKDRDYYKNVYFPERINIIQRLVSSLPEAAGQELLKKIIR